MAQKGVLGIPLGTPIILGVLFAVLLVVLAFVALIADTLQRVPDFNAMKSAVEYTVLQQDGSKLQRQLGPKTSKWVPLSRIANHLLTAVIASEDASFFSHEGIDFHEIRLALKKDLKEKRWARGASTITQQVVKNLYLSREKTLWRKFKEIVWARELDKTFSKPEILCWYVNLAEWGPGIYGIGEASRHYFSVPPSDLTPKQSAFLAMLLPGPTKYYSNFQNRKLSQWAKKRVDSILRIMHRMGYLDADEYTMALAEPLWEELETSKDPLNSIFEEENPEEEISEEFDE